MEYLDKYTMYHVRKLLLHCYDARACAMLTIDFQTMKTYPPLLFSLSPEIICKSKSPEKMITFYHTLRIKQQHIKYASQ